WAAYSGDYGPASFGHAIDTATYLVKHDEFGGLAFGGNVAEEDGRVKVTPKHSFRRRRYLAPRAHWLALDAGAFETVDFHPGTGDVKLTLTSGTAPARTARLRVSQPAGPEGAGKYKPATELPLGSGAYTIDLDSGKATIELKA